MLAVLFSHLTPTPFRIEGVRSVTKEQKRQEPPHVQVAKTDNTGSRQMIGGNQREIKTKTKLRGVWDRVCVWVFMSPISEFVRSRN